MGKVAVDRGKDTMNLRDAWELGEPTGGAALCRE